MELFPTLELGWLNGWIFTAFFYSIFGILLKILPKEVVARLYDEKGWTKLQKVSAKISKIFGILIIILMTFTPLKLESLEFIIGVIIFSIGTIGFIAAILNFANAPLDKPITSGLYKISRNPQMVMLYFIGIGSSIVIGSYIAIILATIGQFLSHFRILGEEKRLSEQYGDPYKDYKKKVPRYFLYF
jgi:protein-S-isoprenylcysteine O-methyltransferase Ste14